jgi:hypothetical protein
MAGRVKKVAIGLGIGCVGLPILIGLVVGSVFLIGSVVYKDAPPVKRETSKLGVPLSQIEPADSGWVLSEQTAGSETHADYGPVVPGKDLPTFDVDYAANARPLRLDIILEEGSFEIVPGPPGSAVKVEGFYDPADYELTQEVEDGGDLGPEMTIRFRRTSSFLALLFKEMNPGENKITITLPRGVPTALNLTVRKGESISELGGLMLTDLNVDMAMGEHELRFSEPAPGKFPQARVRSSMGEMDMIGLGNAHAENFLISGGMGEMRVDFGGAWPDNFVTNANIKFKMGEARISLPESVRLSDESSSSVLMGEGSRSAFQEDNPTDPSAPTLNLNVSMMMGESRVYRNDGSVGRRSRNDSLLIRIPDGEELPDLPDLPKLPELPESDD